MGVRSVIRNARGCGQIIAEAIFCAENYAHRDEVVRAKRSDKRAVEEYLSFALTCLVYQVKTL